MSNNGGPSVGRDFKKSAKYSPKAMLFAAGVVGVAGFIGYETIRTNFSHAVLACKNIDTVNECGDTYSRRDRLSLFFNDQILDGSSRTTSPYAQYVAALDKSLTREYGDTWRQYKEIVRTNAPALQHGANEMSREAATRRIRDASNALFDRMVASTTLNGDTQYQGLRRSVLAIASIGQP